MPPKLTDERFRHKSRLKHGDRYGYSEAHVVDAQTEVVIICPDHGRFYQRPVNHMRGSGCIECVRDRHKMDEKEFFAQAIAKNGDRFDYSSSIFVNGSTDIRIKCNTCQFYFEQRPSNHLRADGCPICTGFYINTEIFIWRAEMIHGVGRYDYSNVIYIDCNRKVIIGCNRCGRTFEQNTIAHLQGQGCMTCALRETARSYAKNTEQFVRDAEIKHGIGRYGYGKVEYYNGQTKVIIMCNECDLEFLQTPRCHLTGRGCPACAKHNSVSKPETDWLNSLGISKDHRQAQLFIGKKRILPDAFDPTTNTIYEFYGDFWHGNPGVYKSDAINNANHKTFGELYRKTLEKEALIKQAGYNLITIWESDWNAMRKQAKSEAA
jgi:hypothetical protein